MTVLTLFDISLSAVIITVRACNPVATTELLVFLVPMRLDATPFIRFQTLP